MAEKINHGKITRLRLVLAQKGVSQRQLAEMSKVDAYKISQICSGKNTNVMLETAKRICFTLGCTLDEAFGDEDDEQQ